MVLLKVTLVRVVCLMHLHLNCFCQAYIGADNHKHLMLVLNIECGLKLSLELDGYLKKCALVACGLML